MEPTYGLLIDYEYCTGCASCVVSCKEEHDYPVGKWGIRIYEDGPWEIEDHRWNYNKIPVPTDLCDLCAERTAKGREPICVHHCLANVMRYGTLDELMKMLAVKPKQVLWTPQYKPYDAKGKFVSKNHKGHQFAAAEVEKNQNFQTSSYRHDARDESSHDGLEGIIDSLNEENI